MRIVFIFLVSWLGTSVAFVGVLAGYAYWHDRREGIRWNRWLGE